MTTHEKGTANVINFADAKKQRMQEKSLQEAQELFDITKLQFDKQYACVWRLVSAAETKLNEYTGHTVCDVDKLSERDAYSEVRQVCNECSVLYATGDTFVHDDDAVINITAGRLASFKIDVDSIDILDRENMVARYTALQYGVDTVDAVTDEEKITEFLKTKTSGMKNWITILGTYADYLQAFLNGRNLPSQKPNPFVTLTRE